MKWTENEATVQGIKKNLKSTTEKRSWQTSVQCDKRLFQKYAFLLEMEHQPGVAIENRSLPSF